MSAAFFVSAAKHSESLIGRKRRRKSALTSAGALRRSR